MFSYRCLLTFLFGSLVLTCALVLPCTAKDGAESGTVKRDVPPAQVSPKQASEKETPPRAIPTARDVRYGRYDRNVLDLYRADTEKLAPVLIHFHGGGWVGGDKAGINPMPYLKSAISVVSANYRFVTGTKDAAPYPAPMIDCARVVQFVRSKAKEWNIDPERIALTGGSAGAVNCMWIAYRDDMAKPDSADPIERFSTRVTCLMPAAGPTTLDPKLIVQRIGGPPSVHGCLLPFFDVKKLDELQSEEKQALVRDASPISHVTRDDPPTYLRYPTPLGGTPLPANTNVMVSIHHAEFGAMVKEKLDEAGVENVLQVVGDGKPTDAGIEFIRRHLKAECVESN